jgi:hypothetical protein
MTGLRFPVFCLLLAVLATFTPSDGEGLAGEPGATLDAKAVPAWAIDFHLSGGLAGRDEQLEVTSAGLLKLSDRRLGLARQGTLSREQREEITCLLAGLREAENIGPASPLNSRCRDCLVFQLVWRTSGKPQTVRVSSDFLSRSPYRELIYTLLIIMDETESPSGSR